MRRMLLRNLIQWILIAIYMSPVFTASDPDLGKDFSGLVKSKGFTPEVHHAITEDGYIIALHRVRCRKRCCAQKVVYLSTPLWMDGDSFVADYANNSIGYLLADNGYDVWIGNARGTKYSRRKINNTNPSSFDTEFFDFTYLDIGLKDIPAGINYVLKVTGRERLFYIGHSQATAGLFALLGRKPEFNDKIIAMAAMCPLRRLPCDVGQKSQYGMLRMVAEKYIYLASLRRFLGEFPPTIQGISLLCRYLPSFCDNTFHFCVGESPNLNSSRLEFYTQIIPAPTSIKNMLLFAQMALRSCLGDYNVYDFDYDQANFRSDIMTRLFGSGDTNMNRYGSLRPPSFTTENIQVPVKLYYAEDDGYATPEEAHRLAKELPNYRGSWNMGPHFGHYDLIMPTYNNTHVLDTIKFLNSFVPQCSNKLLQYF